LIRWISARSVTFICLFAISRPSIQARHPGKYSTLCESGA
jgi:hypothetical protein